MRISEPLQRTMQRIQEIQTRIEQLRGTPSPAHPLGGQTVAPVGFPEGGTPPPGLHILNPQPPTPNSQSPIPNPQFPPTVAHWEPIVAPIAAKYGIETVWVLRIIEAESGGDPNAVSSKGAMGLMQLMPATARALGVQNPFDPAENIEGGVRYLRHLLDRFGDWRLALAAYHAGPGNVERYGGVPPFPETLRYLRRLLG
ncbi:MAG: lytic transglycosylase domain-containing protein [Fimbriimonadales bacterium]|nr:lytic transglycosylase domain-containing protein [Fimbriimonadales bacterium]